MPVAHFLQTRTGRELYEPVWKNLFEVSFDFPALVRQQYPDINDVNNGSGVLALENAKTIGFANIYQDLGTVTQKFKYSDRSFIGFPGSTNVAVNVSFNINHNEQNAILLYNVFRAWYDLGWNSQTGLTHLKRNLIGGMTMNHHDKEGNILRRVSFFNAQLYSFKANMENLAWGGGAPLVESMDCTWICDYWFDSYFDHSTDQAA